MILTDSHRIAVVCLLWFAISLAGLQCAIAQAPPPASSPGVLPPNGEMTRDPQLVIWSDGLHNFIGSVAHNSAHNEFMVGWTTQQDQWSHDIWARRLRPDGTLLDHFNVANVAGERLSGPEIAYCPLHDEYLMAYTNVYDGSSGRADVQARRVAWNGGWMSDVFTITPEVAGHYDPSIAYCGPRDEYVVTYTNEWTIDNVDLYARRLRAGDGALLDMYCVATGGGWARSESQIAFHQDMYGGAGGYLVAYFADAPSPVLDSRIRYKITHTDLSDLCSNPELEVSSTTHANEGPEAAAGQSNFLIAWWEFNVDGYQVRARRIGADGIALGPPEGFPVSGGYAQPPGGMFLAVAYAYPGLFLVVWEHETPSGVLEIHGIFVSEEADTTVGDEAALGSAGTNLQMPEAVCSPDSDCLIAYIWWNFPSWDIAGDIARLVVMFEDGFESGDTSAWSAMVP